RRLSAGRRAVRARAARAARAGPAHLRAAGDRPRSAGIESTALSVDAMRIRLVALGAVVAGAVPWAAIRAASPTATAAVTAPRAVAPLPPLQTADPSLPTLPERSPRNANYTIEARLDPDRHIVDGSLVLEWRNTSGVPLSSFPFHLYWNAFRDNLSTSARGERRPVPRALGDPERDRRFGYIPLRSQRLLVTAGPAAAAG